MPKSCSDAWSSVAGLDHSQQPSYRNSFTLTSICLCCHCSFTSKMQHCSTFAFASQVDTRKSFSFTFWSFWKRIPTIGWLKIKLGLLQSVATGIQQPLSCITECNYAKSSIHPLVLSFVHLIPYQSLIFTECMLSDNTSTTVRFPSPVFFTKVLPF